MAVLVTSQLPLLCETICEVPRSVTRNQDVTCKNNLMRVSVGERKCRNFRGSWSRNVQESVKVLLKKNFWNWPVVGFSKVLAC